MTAQVRDSHDDLLSMVVSLLHTDQLLYESILKRNVCTMIVVMLSLRTLYTHRAGL